MLKQSLALFLFLTLILSLSACNTRQQNSFSAQYEPISSDGLFSGEESMTAEESEVTSEEINSSSQESSTQSSGEESPTTSPPSFTTPESTVISAVESQSLPSENPESSNEPILSSHPHSRPAQNFLSWIEKGGDNIDGNQAFLQAIDDKGKIIIPSSTRNELENRIVSVIENTSHYVFDFYTDVSDVLLENEWYTIEIAPITESPHTDLREYYYPNQTGKKLGTYNGIEYAYFDGYEGIDRFHSVDTAAWFIQDGYLIIMEALYVNNYLPWSNDYFDYFDFETIIL